MTTVAVLGTGTMGAGMARSLLRAGHEVRVWNRNPDRAAPLAADGAVVADSPAAAVAGADAVIVMLYDADSVLDVLEQAAHSAGSETVWLQTATIGMPGAVAVADFAAQHDLKLLDVPVLGTKGPAEQGKLVLLAAGDPTLREVVRPVFDAIASRTVWAGDELGRGTALKLACNAWVASLTAAAAQSLALAGALGLDPTLFLEAIKGGGSDSAYAHLKGAQMLAGRYELSFALDGARKDVGLITAAAAAVGVPTVLLDGVAVAFDAAAAAGYGAQDIAAVFTAFQPT